MSKKRVIYSDEPLMTQSELARQMAAEHGLSISEAQQAIRSVFSTIQEVLTQGKGISIHGFGRFRLKLYAEQDNVIAHSPAHYAVSLSPSKHTKQSVLAVKPTEHDVAILEGRAKPRNYGHIEQMIAKRRA